MAMPMKHEELDELESDNDLVSTLARSARVTTLARALGVDPAAALQIARAAIAEQRSETRMMVEASWRGWKRTADGAAKIPSPAIAGQYLEIANGNVTRALRLVPTVNVFWDRVRSHLTDIATEEGAPLAAPRGEGR